MSNQQPRQSRWGAPLSSSSSVPSSSSTSIPPPAAASSLPEATNNQQMSEFSKNHSATASQRASSSSQHEGQHGDPKHQLHRRGYDMSNSDYYEKEEYRPRSSSTASGSGRGGGREEYGRHFERGREIGGGRSDKLPPRRQDDWKCLECGVYNDPRDDYCRRCNRHYHHYEHDDRDGDDWRCLECGMYNHPRDDRCHRCRQLQHSSYENETSSRPRKKNRRDDDRKERGGGGGGHDQHDEFKQLRDKFKQRQQREWPPSFDTGGASYIFDSRSGMFYHPPSDFFYDPKTKLYYSNKKAQYFHFVGGEDANAIPFLPVQAGGGGNGAAEVVVENPNSDSLDKKAEVVPNPDQKPKIAISLKTKVTNPPVKSLNEVAAFEKSKLNEQKKASRKDSAHLTTETSPPVIPQSHKKHEEDMEKWSGRVKELRNEDEENTNSSTSKKIKTTVSGQPICLLCRRKFASVEKLVQHEKLSALHKANLAKKTAADAEKSSKQKEAEALYKDRAKERRMMHGDLASASGPSSRAEAILAQADGSRAPAISVTKTAEIVRPEDTLGDTNVGNKLLQKLGWKSGDTLGRKQDDENDAQPKGGNDAASSLKSDWERIESLAQGGGRR